MSKPIERRSKKLIQPRLQLKLIGGFLGIAALSLLVQFVLFGYQTSQWAARHPGGEHLTEALPGMLLVVLAVSFGVLLPAVLSVGIVSTFRIAGPLYHVQEHLKGIANGEPITPCHVRKDDELQELCKLINTALEEAQRRGRAMNEDAAGESAAA